MTVPQPADTCRRHMQCMTCWTQMQVRTGPPHSWCSFVLTRAVRPRMQQECTPLLIPAQKSGQLRNPRTHSGRSSLGTVQRGSRCSYSGWCSLDIVPRCMSGTQMTSWKPCRCCTSQLCTTCTLLCCPHHHNGTGVSNCLRFRCDYSRTHLLPVFRSSLNTQPSAPDSCLLTIVDSNCTWRRSRQRQSEHLRNLLRPTRSNRRPRT